MPAIQPDKLRRFVAAILSASGSNDYETGIVADHLVEANLKGHDSHGVGMIPLYIDDRKAGILRTNGKLSIVSDNGPMIVADGDQSSGQVMAHEATKLGIERAKRDGVEIRYYNIIYNVVDDVKAALSGMLAPETREKFLGNAEVLEVFTISKVGKVAGCRVTEGLVRRGAKVRLIRDNVVIHEGELSTLKRFKDEVREVQTGQECGMGFIGYQDLQKGDVIECFEVETIKRAL